MEDEFSKIARESIEAAEKVSCPLDEFVEGLETMFDAIQERLAMARDERDAQS